jgi:hypothetical protein
MTGFTAANVADLSADINAANDKQEEVEDRHLAGRTG